MFAHIISDISQPVLESWVLTSMDAESAASQAAEIEALQVLCLQVSCQVATLVAKLQRLNWQLTTAGHL